MGSGSSPPSIEAEGAVGRLLAHPTVAALAPVLLLAGCVAVPRAKASGASLPLAWERLAAPSPGAGRSLPPGGWVLLQPRWVWWLRRRPPCRSPAWAWAWAWAWCRQWAWAWAWGASRPAAPPSPHRRPWRRSHPQCRLCGAGDRPQWHSAPRPSTGAGHGRVCRQRHARRGFARARGPLLLAFGERDGLLVDRASGAQHGPAVAHGPGPSNLVRPDLCPMDHAKKKCLLPRHG